jgi:tRNA dimethylallyltransferase
VNFDALQVYRRLEAGTAKPTPEERALVPTWLLDVADPTEAWNAAKHQVLADQAIAEVQSRGQWPVLVGGTGLYLRAILRGLADIPEVPAAVRAQLAVEHAERGAYALHAELHAIDPVYAAMTPPQNRQRVLRALEVYRATGRAFSHYHAQHAALPDRHACLLTVLEPPRALLHARIEARALVMAGPLLAEVQGLLQQGVDRDAPAMQAIGYREAVDAVRSDTPVQEFAQQLTAAHKQYAKRQATWFAKEDAQIRLVTTDDAALARLAERWHAWFQSGQQPTHER